MIEHYDESEMFICDCSDVSHNIVFQLWDWQKDGKDDFGECCELSLHVHLAAYPSFWKRIGLAVRYIFGYKSKYGDYDIMDIRYEDVPRIKAILDKFVAKTDEYKGKKL